MKLDEKLIAHWVEKYNQSPRKTNENICNVLRHLKKRAKKHNDTEMLDLIATAFIMAKKMSTKLDEYHELYEEIYRITGKHR